MLQCERDGLAFAEVLNFVGRAAARTPEWLAAFDAELDEHGLALLAMLEERAGGKEA